jgi:WD40 repeat protein
VQAGEKIVELSHHNDKSNDGIPNVVNCIAWSHDGTRLASCCYDSSIFVWDPESGDLMDSYTVDRGNIYSVDWHPVKPDLIAASTSSHGAWIWSMEDPQPQRVDTERMQSRCIRWSPEGTRFAVCRDDGLVTIHDSETTELQVSLNNHLGQVFCVDWHPSGNRLATASEDGTVRIWDAATGTQTISFERFGGSVACVAWSHNGQSLAVGGERGIVHIIDATVGYERAVQESPH